VSDGTPDELGRILAAFQADRVARRRAHLERVVDSPPDPLLA